MIDYASALADVVLSQSSPIFVRMLDTSLIREDFPILRHEVYDRPLVYFDNAATTQKPRCVVEKIEEAYYNVNANIHRGVHYLSQQATEAHEAARESVRAFLNASSSSEIIFTRGTTEAINLVASSYARSCMRPGDEVIVTAMEHHSNIVPWQLQGMRLRVIPLDERGGLDLEVLPGLFNDRTRMVAITHMSNVLGTVNPIAEIARVAHAHGVPIMVDGAQAVAHRTIDVQATDVDFYAFSSHKIYGPTGIGVLYGKVEWLDRIPPYQGGGEMIRNVSFEQTTYNELPYKFEAGTPDFIGSTALAVALDYVRRIGLDAIARHEHELLRYATERLSAIPGMRIIGHVPEKSSVLSFLAGDIHPYDLGMILDRLGIAIRTGHHCAEPLMHVLGVEGTARASFALYNTKAEIDALAEGIERARKMF